MGRPARVSSTHVARERFKDETTSEGKKKGSARGERESDKTGRRFLHLHVCTNGAMEQSKTRKCVSSVYL